LTTTTTVELPESTLSLAVRLSVYVPGTVKAAVVIAALGSVMTIGPGPLTVLQL